MQGRFVVVGLLGIALVAAGCAGSELKARKDNAWSHVPQSLPDGAYWDNPYTKPQSKLPDPTLTGFEPTPGSYGHPFRGAGLILHPVGVALDYALVRPFYMLGALAPEWFGLTAEDGQNYQRHFPELTVPRDTQRLYD